jgi:hypothetical protein
MFTVNCSECAGAIGRDKFKNSSEVLQTIIARYDTENARTINVIELPSETKQNTSHQIIQPIMVGTSQTIGALSPYERIDTRGRIAIKGRVFVDHNDDDVRFVKFTKRRKHQLARTLWPNETIAVNMLMYVSRTRRAKLVETVQNDSRMHFTAMIAYDEHLVDHVLATLDKQLFALRPLPQIQPRTNLIRPLLPPSLPAPLPSLQATAHRTTDNDDDSVSDDDEEYDTDGDDE